jgi:uncharacterized protein YejL (UPF0352 family)
MRGCEEQERRSSFVLAEGVEPVERVYCKSSSVTSNSFSFLKDFVAAKKYCILTLVLALYLVILVTNLVTNAVIPEQVQGLVEDLGKQIVSSVLKRDGGRPEYYPNHTHRHG